MRNYASILPPAALLLMVLLSGCGSVKHGDMILFQQVQNEKMNIDSLHALTIQTDDILSIQVASRNPQNVIAFQSISSSQRQSSGGTGDRALGTPDGYRVDEEGNVYLPFLGAVSAAGKTVLELRGEIGEKLKEFIPDASVQVRFLNFKVTLLGEVIRPNTYTIPNERLTILEAIGMAGDFTSYARRGSVLVIRDRNGVRESARVNVQDKSVFLSPYFYLSPNDIVYVEPLKAKQYATQGDFFQRYANFLFPMVSLTTFILGATIFKK